MIIRETLAQATQCLEQYIIMDAREYRKPAAATLLGLGDEARHGKSECTVVFERTQSFLGYEQGSMFGALFDAAGPHELGERRHPFAFTLLGTDSEGR